MILPPAVEVHHVAHLVRRREGEQPDGVRESDLLDRIEEHLGRKQPYEIETMAGRQYQVLPRLSIDLTEPNDLILHGKGGESVFCYYVLSYIVKRTP